MSAAHAGELLIVGFEGKRAPAELLERIAAGRVAGVILFARNLGSLDEVAALLTDLAHANAPGSPPLILSVDQEGGRVQRIKSPFTLWPPMACLGERDDVALSETVGAAVGRELRSLGFNVDYAPVLDVHTNPANPIIGDRAFAPEPRKAARHALAFLRGLESAGVRGCGKHFPGHGDTATDSHLTLPRVDVDESRLREIELEPFALGASALGMIMTAHVVYPAIDPLPATLSARWLTEILRGELGFGGVVVSDDLDMKAVADRWPVEETVTASLRAGADAFLACRDVEVQRRAETTLEELAARSPELRVRVDASIARVRAFRHTLAPPSSPEARARLPLAEHARLAARMRGDG